MENLKLFFVWSTEMEDQKKRFRQKGHLDFCQNQGVLFCAQSEEGIYIGNVLRQTYPIGLFDQMSKVHFAVSRVLGSYKYN